MLVSLLLLLEHAFNGSQIVAQILQHFLVLALFVFDVIPALLDLTFLHANGLQDSFEILYSFNLFLLHLGIDGLLLNCIEILVNQKRVLLQDVLFGELLEGF